MNIDDYRELKAAEEEHKVEQKAEQESKEEEPVEVETKEEPKKELKEEEKPKDETKEKGKDETKKEQTSIDKVTIEGIGDVSIDELKNGYMRQSDYTKKTQTLATQRKEVEQAIQLVEHFKANPEVAAKLAEEGNLPKGLDPAVVKVQELENKLYDLMLEQEINKLSTKYDDFDVRETLKTAHEKGITDLEDAYLLTKKSKPSKAIDIEKLKLELREEIMKEVKADKDTGTIISSNGTNEVVEDKMPTLSDAEKRVAKNMFRKSKNPLAEYAKWRDIGKKK